MDITIRQFRPDELETLRELNRYVFESDQGNMDYLNTAWPDTEPATEYYNKVVTGNGAIGFVAEVDGKVAGYVALAVRDKLARTKKVC